VVPEFDTPGHATSMCFAYPDLCSTLPGCGWPEPRWVNEYAVTPFRTPQGQNVSLNAIEAVLNEIAAISPDDCMHLGGDEVDQTCWQTDPAVQKWMVEQGFGNNTGPRVRVLCESPLGSSERCRKSLCDLPWLCRSPRSMPCPLRTASPRSGWEEVWTHFGTDLDKRTIIHGEHSGQPTVSTLCLHLSL